MFYKKYENNLLEKNIIDNQKIWSFVLLESKLWIEYKKMSIAIKAEALISITENILSVYSANNYKGNDLTLLLRSDLKEINDIVTKKHFRKYELYFQTKDSQIQCTFKSKKKWKLFVDTISYGGDINASV